MKRKIDVDLDVIFDINATQGQIDYFFKEIKYRIADLINERKASGFIKTSILCVEPQEETHG